MPDFSTLEDTLFVPMLGRIYASKQLPQILYDAKALELEEKLPHMIKGKTTQTQYTCMASAIRSTNVDRYIRHFIKHNPGGIIVDLGCGLKTAFYRNDDGNTLWYEVDLPDVIAYHKGMLGPQERSTMIAADAFSEEWITQIRNVHPDAPLLITASGLFYYFEQNKVHELFRIFGQYGNIEIVFDTVNAKGMRQMAKYMKQVGHEDAAMYFYVDNGMDLAQKVGAQLIAEETYYKHTDKKGLQWITRMTMQISDQFKMVKMLHLKFDRRDNT